MKTIRQIAEEIGVSRQAVHKKIQKEPLATNLKGHTVNTKQGLQIKTDGENMIKLAFKDAGATTASTNKVANALDRLIESLQGQINTLTEQNQDLREQLGQERQHSREQADKITELATDMAKLANNAQQLHALDNVKPQLTESKKKGLLQNIFSKKVVAG